MSIKYINSSKIFVTGGTGPFGEAFLRYLNSKNVEIEIFLLTRNPNKVYILQEKYKNLIIHSIHGCLPFKDKDFIHKLPKVDFILHMASVTAEESFNKINPLQKYLLLNEGTIDICNYGKLVNVERLLFTSSGCVYGSNSNNYPMKETINLKVNGNSAVNDSLSIGKISAEYICNYFREFESLETKIARCFSFCGLGIPTNLHYAIGNFTSQAIKGEDIVIKGDGLAIRSYMDLDDLGNWLCRLLLSESNFDIYNFGSDEEISISDLANKIKSLSKSSSNILVLGKSNVTLSNPLRDYYVPDIQRARKELNVSLEHNLDDSIVKYINYLRNL